MSQFSLSVDELLCTLKYVLRIGLHYFKSFLTSLAHLGLDWVTFLVVIFPTQIRPSGVDWRDDQTKTKFENERKKRFISII